VEQTFPRVLNFQDNLNQGRNPGQSGEHWNLGGENSRGSIKIQWLTITDPRDATSINCAFDKEQALLCPALLPQATHTLMYNPHPVEVKHAKRSRCLNE
jgi:hypothetical protein